MLETKKQIDAGNLVEDLADVKNSFLSRRKAIKKAGKAALGTGLVFLGLCLPGTLRQKPAFAMCTGCAGTCIGSCSGGCTGCTGCSGSCSTTCSTTCTGGCQGGCTGCSGCTGCTSCTAWCD